MTGSVPFTESALRAASDAARPCYRHNLSFSGTLTIGFPLVVGHQSVLQPTLPLAKAVAENSRLRPDNFNSLLVKHRYGKISAVVGIA